MYVVGQILSRVHVGLGHVHICMLNLRISLLAVCCWEYKISWHHWLSCPGVARTCPTNCTKSRRPRLA
jgi:hypothetical protein